MKIVLKKIKVKDIYKGFIDNSDTGEGIVAYEGKLNVQPKYQREFVYDDSRQKKVINSIINNFPINVLYRVKIADDKYELLDGQQRTVSICRFVANKFSYLLLDKTTGKSNPVLFSNLSKEKQEQILNYELYIYICEGTEEETLDWFKTINIAGLTLTDQEMRNAIYSGPFIEDLKRYFSKPNCALLKYSDFSLEKYLSGSRSRQDYLEIALKWVSRRDGHSSIEEFLSTHKSDDDASFVFDYVVEAISWARRLFVLDKDGKERYYKKEMKGLDWGFLYEEAKKSRPDLITPTETTREDVRRLIEQLYEDEDVTKKSGVFDYVVRGEEKSLSLRAFDDKTKTTVYSRQNGICSVCGRHFDIKEMEADHIVPRSKGGRTTIDNCQMLCKSCNRRKSDY